MRVEEAAIQEIRELFEQAVAAGRSRDYGKAVELLSRVVASTDQFPQALLYLGRSYHALGETAKAARVLASYLRQRPDSAAGHFFLARSLIALGQYPQAVRHLREAVRRNPSLSAAYGLLGFVYLKARRSGEAVASFRKALELDPASKSLLAGYLNATLVAAIRLFYRNHLVDSAHHFNEILRHRPDSIAPHLYLAAIYREMGKGNTALFHLDTACALSPQDPILHLQKALIHLEMGQEDQAKEEIRIGRYFLKSAASVGSSPREVLRFITVRLFMNGRYKEAVFYAAKLLKTSYKDVQMHALVAEAYRNLGDLEKARNHFLRALEIDRESPEIRYGLLGVLWSLGRTEEVLAQARRLLQARPDDPMGLYFQSLALSRGDGDLEQTIKALQAQIRLTGPDPALMTALGGAYLKAGLAELAEGWYVRTLTVSPADTEALRSLADLYTSRGPREKALEALKRYLETDPEDAARRRALLRLLLEDEAFGEAADQIARLLTGEPRSAKLRAMLALCYRRSGKYSDALILLKDLLRKDPGSEELMKAVVYCLDKMGARPLAMQVLGDFMKRHGEKGGLLLMLGVLHFQDGKLEKSAETFRRAISLSPRDWKAHRNLGMVYRKMGNTEFAEAFLARAEEYRVKSADPG